MAKRTAWIMAWRLIWRSGHVREEASSGKATRVLILSHYYNLAVRRDTDMRPYMILYIRPVTAGGSPVPQRTSSTCVQSNGSVVAERSARDAVRAVRRKQCQCRIRLASPEDILSSLLFSASFGAGWQARTY